MAYHATSYEIAAVHPDGRSFLIGYTPRKSRRGLFCAMVERGASIIKKLGVDEEDVIIWSTKPQIHARIREWSIGFTGRTLKDVEHRGEASLPFIAD